MKKMKKKIIGFIHTINGYPAEYIEGEQICYGRRKINLVKSLPEIKKQQRLSLKWRREKLFSSNSISEEGYGHLTIVLPDKRRK